MKLLITIGIFFCLPLMVTAQPYTSQPNGFFTVNEVSGCAPLTVTLNANPACSGTGCDVDYLGNNGWVTLSGTSGTFTYTQPGTYNLRLNRGVQVDNIQIQVFANIPPTFEAYACSGNRVSLNITDTNFPIYTIDYNNDGTPEVQGPRGSYSHSYGTPGTRTIAVKGKNIGDANNCTASSRTVTVSAALPPPTIDSLVVINSSQIKLIFNTQPNVLYRLEILNNNSFQLLKNIYNITTDTVKNLRTDDLHNCFRLGVVDPCSGNAITYSTNTICSANFDLAVLNKENRLTWTSGPGVGFTSYTMAINGPFGAGIDLNVASPYRDTVNIVCGEPYCYRLITNYNNGSKSFSLTKCDTAISTDIPAAIENTTAIVGSSSVDLVWQPVTGFTPDEFTIIKSINGSYKELIKTTNFQINDPEYETAHASCYKISYKDVCDNLSPLSNDVCPIRLSGSLQGDNSIILSWTDYNGWKDGVSRYVVEKRSVQGQLLVPAIDVGTATTYTDASQDLVNQIYIYVIRAIASDISLVQNALSNSVTIIKNPNLYHPTAFTPNGDNMNDIFNVYGQYVTGFEMNIFNRWGELMFTTTDLDQGWDGYFKGNAMPEGTYTFVANITDLAGRTFTRSGTVLLLKKK